MEPTGQNEKGAAKEQLEGRDTETEMRKLGMMWIDITEKLEKGPKSVLGRPSVSANNIWAGVINYLYSVTGVEVVFIYTKVLNNIRFRRASLD